ncbi:MAG: CARDB domain-containing protein [Candidatus Nanoarchaeia archaeon]
MATKKSKILIAILVILSALTSVNAITYYNASIVNASNLAQLINMSYEPETIKAYRDGAGGNPDITLSVCADENLTGKYGSFVYKIGNWSVFLPLGGTATSNFSVFDNNISNCYYINSTWDFLSDYAIYPGYIYAVVSADDVFDTDNFIFVGNKSWLKGRYLFNNYQLTYNQTTGNINVNVTKIFGNTISDEREIWPGGAAVSKERILMAVCDINESSLLYYDCENGNKTSPGVMNTLYTGVTNPQDNKTVIKYLIVNGIPHAFCIGPDLSITNLTITPSEVFQSELVILNATIKNANNVDVTSPFNISFYEGGSLIGNINIANLSADAITYATLQYDTTGFSSGVHTILAIINASGIGDCNLNNNNKTANFTIKKTYSLTTFINGQINNDFPIPGVPYNFSVKIQDSDNNTDLPNITIKIVEKNGLNLFAPIQGFEQNSEKYGVISYSIAETKTNSSGEASLAIIPLGNKLLVNSEYNYLNVSQYVGNYSMYIEIYNNTEKLQLYDPSTDILIDQYDLFLLNHTILDPQGNERNSIISYNYNSWVKQIIELAVQIFGNVQKWIKD